MNKITGKIISYKVMTTSGVEEVTADRLPTELEERPEILLGSTYKLKTPESEHAMYITINDYILNAGTSSECRRPYEIFINSKNVDNYQWMVAMTRLISAVFRKGGDVTFLLAELSAIYDPKGGYFKKSKFMPSLVAEIGEVLQKHFVSIGLVGSNG